MRLLLAEDHQALGQAICAYMKRAGHAIEWVTDGLQLLTQARRPGFECVLLDLGMPEISGRDCLIKLRTEGCTTPVIVTTAQGHRDHRVEMLNLGADDYLVKPLDLAELAARVQAVHRRSVLTPDRNVDVQTYGELTLLAGSNQVKWQGCRVDLTTTEFKILALLARRHGQSVSRAQIEAEIYGDNELVSANSIDVHIHHLRRKLGSDLLQTLRGIGFRLKLP
jgi:DNA-binding response OmpR family regulator